MSNAATLIELTKTQDKVNIDDLNAIYDALPPLSPEFMLGDWRGSCFNSGHPGEGKLGALGWAGKQFNSISDVKPIMSRGDDGALVVNPIMGEASLKKVEYRGVVTATMVYDSQPIFDHFKKLDDNSVLGVMDAKGDTAPLYFLLQRA